MEEILIKFCNYLTAPGASVPAITGLVIGFAAGMFLSKPMWDFWAEGRRFKREDREAERKRKEDAAKRRLEASKKRKNEKRPYYGILWDRDGNPYCPVCQRQIQPFTNDEDGDYCRSFCYACNKSFVCDTSDVEIDAKKIWNK